MQTASGDKFTIRAAEFYRAQRSIEISLELAVLDDGTAIGPDQEGKIALFKAWLDAERDFSKRALGVKYPEELGLMVRNIRDHAYESLAPPNPKTTARSLSEKYCSMPPEIRTVA